MEVKIGAEPIFDGLAQYQESNDPNPPWVYVFRIPDQVILEVRSTPILSVLFGPLFTDAISSRRFDTLAPGFNLKFMSQKKICLVQDTDGEGVFDASLIR